MLGMFALSIPSVAEDAWPLQPPGLTAYQQQLLATLAETSKAASQVAGEVLLEEFSSSTFRMAMLAHGDADALRLATTSSAAILEELRQNLESMEYTSNFGLTAQDRAAHPGKAGPNLTTIDYWGFYPNMWQMKIMNSTLMQGVPDRQWDIYDGAEVGLYDMKGFAHPHERNPTWAEAAERPSYTYKSLRRADTGCEVYGAYTLVFRNGVMRDRALIASTDTGGWENACNQSLPLGRAQDWWFKLFYGFYDCVGMGGPDYNESGFHANIAMPGHEFQTIVGNSKALRKMGGGGSSAVYLSRLVWQMLSRHAKYESIETLWNTEALVMGSVLMEDVKLMVASFPGLFGTKEGDELIDFCRRHKLPLAWGLGDGRQGTERHVARWLPPPTGHPSMEAGRARLMDPSTVYLTNGTLASSGAIIHWSGIDAEVRKARAAKDPTHEEVFKWWDALRKTQMSVTPLRGIDCANTDLCFGVETFSQQCICRHAPDASEILV